MDETQRCQRCVTETTEQGKSHPSVPMILNIILATGYNWSKGDVEANLKFAICN